MWEPQALVPVYTALADLVGLTRIADRLEISSKTAPSLKLHFRLAKQALLLVRRDSLEAARAAAAAELAVRPARSFIGWAATIGFVARGCNQIGQHAEARALCADALAHVTDADRMYATLFLPVEQEMALAEAALGDVDGALARVDGLLARFRGMDHPLVQGQLHEARARIAWSAARREEYDASLAEMVRWFRPTGTPALIAKCERLAELSSGAGVRTAPQSAPARRRCNRRRRGAQPASRDRRR